MGSCVKAACPGAEAVSLCPLSSEEGSLGKISLSCCHFAGHMKNPSVPHYHVDFSSLPPIALFRKEILRWLKVDARMSCLITVSEAKRNIFAATRIQMAIDYQFREADREYPRNNKYVISIHPTSEVEEYFSALSTCYRSGSSSLFAPSRRWISSSNTSNGIVAGADVTGLMMIGADVTHPAADQQVSTKPSIAAVVVSVDPLAAQYVREIQIRASKLKYIEEKEDMVYQLLPEFHRSTGRISASKPQHTMVYRGGVSERQFAKALDWELPAVRKACLRLDKGSSRPISFVVVQKRHHTLLFPDSPRDECGRRETVPSGSVVNSNIAILSDNFFLVSHQCPIGTSLLTVYHLLYGLGFNTDGSSATDVLPAFTYFCAVLGACRF